ncbi:MAG: hypothetical protein KF781_00810 [Chitinophagaceae bacterium]|nr:hypothetical protein [Chitinophagaceae bacterium]MCW5905275.1 hypothetical protein [Chitinophagaceae bacterium]
MKKIVLLVSLLFAGNFVYAQVMSAKAQTVVIKSDNLKCWQCKERLEKYLVVENKAYLENALLEWKINLLKGEIKIKYLPDRATIDDIRTALNNAGFDADDEKAEETAYNKLPTACKRAEDGGGPKKGAPCHIKP